MQTSKRIPRCNNKNAPEKAKGLSGADLLLNLSFSDSAYRASTLACAAIDAGSCINFVLAVSHRDSANRACAFACATCNA